MALAGSQPLRTSSAASASATSANLVRPRSCNSGLRAMTSRRCAACKATWAPSTGADVGERREQRLKRGELRVGPAERLGQQPRQPLRAGKEHVALVGEVAGERAPRQSGAMGDLGNGDVLVPELEEELDRGGAQSFFCLRIPPSHTLSVQ